MKKILTVVFTLMAVFTLSGCGKKIENAKSKLTYQEALVKTEEASKEATNYKVGMTMNIAMNTSIQGFSMDIDASVKVNAQIDVKNKKMYMSTEKIAKGEETEKDEVYVIYDDSNNTVTTYTKEEGKWTKTTLPVQVDFEESNMYGKEIIDELKKIVKAEQIDADKDNYNYELTVNMNELGNLFAGTGSMADEMIGNVKGDIKMNLSLDKSNYSLKKMKVDLLPVMNENKVEGLNISKFNYELDFYDYGKVEDIKVPEEVLANAVEKSLENVEENLENVEE